MVLASEHRWCFKPNRLAVNRPCELEVPEGLGQAKKIFGRDEIQSPLDLAMGPLLRCHYRELLDLDPGMELNIPDFRHG